jgi:hypothetical protein
MKKAVPPAESSRFSGNLRHYHRSGAQAPRSWDDWVDGPTNKSRLNRNWPKIAVIVVAGFALSGIVTGLIVELS